MKIASLFDGSGGFPLAGMQCGMTPIWASEVEPYPIRVTRDRIPGMKHLGSVTEIKGDQVEIPDVITFGSPCQDLSVAGKQKGIHEGERSSLFFEAIRIIKEMRAHDRATGRADEHVRPRYAVWENVPGAYSSNGGRDFQAVLQAFCDIGRPGDHVPYPQKWGVQGASWAKVTALPGEHMMLNTGPGPHNGESASTLSQILQANAPEKYFLSKKACQGIINRAKKRGKELPKILLEALQEVIETS